MADEGMETVKRVCVTGAAGYIGSWLVKNLLQRGYTVNATLRDPGHERKTGPLIDLPGAKDRLKLFQADLLKEGSFDSAVEGCEGVFHVAGSMGPQASLCYAKKQALGEVEQEILDTQVNPAVWKISGHMVLKRKEDFERASEDYAWDYSPKSLCQNKNLKKSKLISWKQQAVKRCHEKKKKTQFTK